MPAGTIGGCPQSVAGGRYRYDLSQPCDAARLFLRSGVCWYPSQGLLQSSKVGLPPPSAGLPGGHDSQSFLSGDLTIHLPCNLFFRRAAYALRSRLKQVFGTFAF